MKYLMGQRGSYFSEENHFVCLLGYAASVEIHDETPPNYEYGIPNVDPVLGVGVGIRRSIPVTERSVGD